MSFESLMTWLLMRALTLVTHRSRDAITVERKVRTKVNLVNNVPLYTLADQMGGIVHLINQKANHLLVSVAGSLP